MITSIFHLCATFAAGWALRPASGQTNFPTTIPTTFPTTIPTTFSTTTPTICVRTSRARRNLWQAKQMRLAVVVHFGSMTQPKINHRGTETQRFHREGRKTGKILLTFWSFSVKPLCLCASVVNLGRISTTTRLW
jgi:hypothetical protein